MSRAAKRPARAAAPKAAARPRRGARGALLDLYEEALDRFKAALEGVDGPALEHVLHPDEPDENCRSIASVVRHVVRAGYGYPTYILRHRRGDESLPRPSRRGAVTVPALCAALDDVFAYTVRVLAEVREREMIAVRAEDMVATSWGQRFDYDSLMEHAVMHVHRHRRQVERFKRELARR